MLLPIDRPTVDAIWEGDIDRLAEKIQQNPLLINSMGVTGGDLLVDAAARNQFKICEYLVEQGADVNKVFGAGTSALSEAIRMGNFDVAQFLLRKNANPNVGRILFSVSKNEHGNGQALFELLLKHKIEMNRLYAMFGDAAHPISALDFVCDGPFAEIFRKAGAKTAKEILAENPNTEIDGRDAKP